MSKTLSAQAATESSIKRTQTPPERISHPYPQPKLWLKRMLDIGLITSTSFLTIPLILLIAAAIKLTSRGPAFFRQRRYGKHNRVFHIWKFRTMIVLEDGQDFKQAVRGDPRVTKLGQVLRRTSLDELPQIFNILEGSMSIVGPRPHPLALNDHYRDLIPDFDRRQSVAPGLTGLAQVNGSRGETRDLEAMHKRINYDLEYIDNWSISLDLWIIFTTMTEMVRSKTAY